MSSDEPARVQRFEVFTGSGRRRAWSPEEKAAIVAESLLVGETVCGVARRYGLTPQQLFSWRRQARVATGEDGLGDGPAFLPAVVAAELPAADRSEPVRRRGRPKGSKEPGLFEVEIDGATIRVGRGAETKAVTAILLALKGQS